MRRWMSACCVQKSRGSFTLVQPSRYRVYQKTCLCPILPFHETLNSSWGRWFFSICNYWTRWSTFVLHQSLSKVIGCPKMTNYGTKTCFWDTRYLTRSMRRCPCSSRATDSLSFTTAFETRCFSVSLSRKSKTTPLSHQKNGPLMYFVWAQSQETSTRGWHPVVRVFVTTVIFLDRVS